MIPIQNNKSTLSKPKSWETEWKLKAIGERFQLSGVMEGMRAWNTGEETKHLWGEAKEDNAKCKKPGENKQ